MFLPLKLVVLLFCVSYTGFANLRKPFYCQLPCAHHESLLLTGEAPERPKAKAEVVPLVAPSKAAPKNKVASNESSIFGDQSHMYAAGPRVCLVEDAND